MGCNDDYCEIGNEPGKCPICGGMPIIQVNFMTAWIRCADCGHCVTGENEADAVEKWRHGDDYKNGA